jgi:hypothetical protein
MFTQQSNTLLVVTLVVYVSVAWLGWSSTLPCHAMHMVNKQQLVSSVNKQGAAV